MIGPDAPPLVPGVPVTWDATVLAFAVARLLVRAGLEPLPHGLIDAYLAPYGAARRVPGHRKFLVACPRCGHRWERLVLTAGAVWACQTCTQTSARHVVWIAAALQFALRIGSRSRFTMLLHRVASRKLVRGLARISRAEEVALILTVSRVLSVDPRPRARPRGPLRALVGPGVVDDYLEHVASPAAYAARCAWELGLQPAARDASRTLAGR